MKTKAILFTALILVFLVSCKKETEEKKADVQQEQKNEFFHVALDVVTPVEDDFAVYYTEDNTINFTSEKAIWGTVKGQTSPQQISFNLPEEALPTDIRVDFGHRKTGGDVTLQKFTMDYYGNKFEFKGSDFFTYFINNNSGITQVDSAGGTITFKRKGDTIPFYYPQPTLLREISKITK